MKLHKTEEVIFAENEIAKQNHLKFLLKNEESQASLNNLECNLKSFGILRDS